MKRTSKIKSATTTVRYSGKGTVRNVHPPQTRKCHSLDSILESFAFVTPTRGEWRVRTVRNRRHNPFMFSQD